MLEKKKVGFAISGCGIIADAHIKGIVDTEAAELVAVCDRVEEKARQVADQYGVACYFDYEEMLVNEAIDIVCICTPSGLHAEQVILAAEAGKHILVEKPMAIRHTEIEAILHSCNSNGVKLGTIFPRRMSPQARFVKSFIEAGRLGRLSLCNAFIKIYRDQAYYDSAGWRGTWQMDGGGVLMNQGIHMVDLLQWLVGPVASLTAKASNILRDIEVEDTATAILQFDRGALGIIAATTTAYPAQGSMIEIHGDNGTIVLTGDEITTLELRDEAVELPPFEPFSVLPDGHRVQIRDMALAVQEDREPIVSGSEGKHAIEIILGIYQSAETHQEIALADSTAFASP